MIRRLLWLWLYSIACAFYILADWARDYTADRVRGVEDEPEAPK